MTPQEYAAGLREFADWIERHAEDLPASSLADDRFRLLLYATDGDELARYAWMLETGGEEVLDGKYYELHRHFGPVDVQAYATKETVCARTVVGTRIVDEERWQLKAEVQALLVAAGEEVER